MTGLMERLDDIPRPAWIALVVVSFIVFWPIGLASPGSAASRRTAPGASASMTAVSNRPACASPPGSPACQACADRPS